MLTLYPIRAPSYAPRPRHPVVRSPGLWGAEVLGLGAPMNLAVCGRGLLVAAASGLWSF